MKNQTKNFVLLLILIGFILLSPGFSLAQEDTNLKLPAPASDSPILLPKKSPFGALVRSVAFPGWGQFYNKKGLKGSIVFVAETSFLIAAVVEWRRMNDHLKKFKGLPLDSPDKAWEFELYKYNRDMRNTHLWCVAGIAFLSMLDAYVDAHLFNFEQEKIGEMDISLVPKMEKEQVGIVLSINF